MKSINHNAPVQCNKSITINAGSTAVWEALSNINNWSRWQTDISRPRLNGLLLPGSTFDWKSGGVGIHSTLHTVNPNTALGWTGKTLGLYAIHNWSLSEHGSQTTVTVTESMEGFLAGLFKKSINKTLDKGLQKWLELLKLECER